MDLPKYIQKYYKEFTIGIEFEEHDINIEPYALGYWLGDGDSDYTIITSPDPEISEYFIAFAKNNNLVFKKLKRLYAFSISTGIQNNKNIKLHVNILK